MRCHQSTAKLHSLRTTMCSSWRWLQRRPRRSACMSFSTRSHSPASTALASTTTGPLEPTPASTFSTRARPTRLESCSSQASRRSPMVSCSTTAWCAARLRTLETTTAWEHRRHHRPSSLCTQAPASRLTSMPSLVVVHFWDTRLRRSWPTPRPPQQWEHHVVSRTGTERLPSHSAETASSSGLWALLRTAPSPLPFATPSWRPVWQIWLA
mmetsp:Transcript_40929/g.96130  ORF Transcript_40929/g.96130 Transcript_40929/m.96130 type:complete len:211 (+) Transcript_40929:963-1595(+)